MHSVIRWENTNDEKIMCAANIDSNVVAVEYFLLLSSLFYYRIEVD